MEVNSVFLCISRETEIEQISAEEVDGIYKMTPYWAISACTTGIFSLLEWIWDE